MFFLEYGKNVPHEDAENLIRDKHEKSMRWKLENDSKRIIRRFDEIETVRWRLTRCAWQMIFFKTVLGILIISNTKEFFENGFSLILIKLNIWKFKKIPRISI